MSDTDRWQDSEQTLPGADTTRRGPGARPADFGRGDVVGRYLLLERAGAGGMGVVFAAYDPELDRRVALKLVHPDGGATEATVAGHHRLVREAQAMARLSHPNVIAVHDAGEFEGGVFVAMEFVEGPTLKAWMAERRHSWREVVKVFVQAGRGLAAAHEAQLVHRDFKPDNVMIGSDDRVRVMDFGLARALVDSDPSADAAADEGSERDSVHGLGHEGRIGSRGLSDALTRTGAMVGTPAYMAPEQHMGERADARADQFSFCMALWEALYGARAFEGKTHAAFVLSVAAGKLVSPPRGTDVPGWLHQLVVRGLEVDPSRRHSNMNTLVEALSRDPAERRRHYWSAGAIGVGVVGLLAATTLSAGPPALCVDSRSRLDGVWDDDARAALDKAFSADERTQSIAERVSAGLDAYADAWVAGHQDACQATHVRHEQSQSLLDRRSVCLDERKRDLAALVGVLAREGLDGETADKAITAVGKLPRVESCADSQRLLAQMDPPPAELAQAVEDVRRGLAESLALQQAGHPLEALERARELAPQGDLGYPPLDAEIQMRLGVALEGAGEYEHGAASLEEAVYTGRASGHDELARLAATRLVYVVGRHLARADEAARWGRLAKAELARAGSDPEGEASLENNLGVVAIEKSDPTAAAEHFRRSIELREATLGKQHPDVATAVNNLGNALYMKGEPEAAIVAHRRALQIRQSVFGTRHPQVAMSWENIGIAYEAMGQYTESVEHLAKSLEVRESIWGSKSIKIAGSLNNLGSAIEGSGDRKLAIEHYRRALALREKHLRADHPNIGDSLVNLGLALQEEGELADAIELLQRAHRVYEKGRPDSFSEAVAVGNLGGALAEAERFDEAYAAYAHALQLKTKLLNPDHPSLAFTLGGQGHVLVEMGEAKRALGPLHRALEIRENAKVDPLYVAASQFGLAKGLRAAKADPERAAELGNAALGAYRAAGDSSAKDAEEVAAWLEST